MGDGEEIRCRRLMVVLLQGVVAPRHAADDSRTATIAPAGSAVSELGEKPVRASSSFHAVLEAAIICAAHHTEGEGNHE